MAQDDLEQKDYKDYAEWNVFKDSVDPGGIVHDYTSVGKPRNRTETGPYDAWLVNQRLKKKLEESTTPTQKFIAKVIGTAWSWLIGITVLAAAGIMLCGLGKLLFESIARLFR